MEIYKVTNTFSREYKFSLGQDMRRDTLSLFRNLYRANKNKDKTAHLEAFLDDFELLRLEIRVCLDLKLLSFKKMAEIALITDSISKQVTAWKNRTKDKDKDKFKNKNCQNLADYGLTGWACFIFKRAADSRAQETRPGVKKKKRAAGIVCLVFVRVHEQQRVERERQ